MAKVVTLKIKNCLDCPHHQVLPDPDPNDWFCDDDEKVVCNKANGRVVTCANRPYETRKSSVVPAWCPLGK
jgi:hypothetical protein